MGRGGEGRGGEARGGMGRGGEGRGGEGRGGEERGLFCALPVDPSENGSCVECVICTPTKYNA